ncbi:hypothetical protein TrRE_jg12390 [Triparma retinervis]|uniref:Uncharacterized protein n=1 Tax=Triparma retinervis TaxID=2557542 RepID=A0A9W7G710_9STRA|nr:hypothetical protein TrRE_jg12390 [Triparma retinervis]
MALSSSPLYEQAKRSRILHLNDRGLDSIPSPVFNLDMITRLDLSYNNITEIPPEIQYMTNLENLWLNGNPLKSVPTELQHCRKLKVLDIRDTMVETMPREIGRLKNLFLVDLRGTPLSEELDPFRGNTEELLTYLDVKDKRTNIAIEMENNLLAAKYLETGDMVEGGIVVKALVKAVCAVFPDMGELRNCARNADRLFPKRYSSPVELRKIFHTNPSDGPAVRRQKWGALAEKVAAKEAAKLKKDYVTLTRENEMVKLSADMELKISAIYYDNHDPTEIEGWLKSIYAEFKPENYLEEGRKDCPDLEDIHFIIQFATRIFPSDPSTITGKLIRSSMLSLQKKLTDDRIKCVRGINSSLSGIYADREPPQVARLAQDVAKLFERDRFATDKELEDLKKISADANLLFPAEFDAAEPKEIKKLFKQREAAAKAAVGR